MLQNLDYLPLKFEVPARLMPGGQGGHHQKLQLLQPMTYENSSPQGL